MAMSDRIAIMNDGVIEQIGSPREVYEQPLTPFVARFIGTSNILERNGRRWSLRPERLSLVSPDDASSRDGREYGTISDVVYLGMTTRYIVQLNSGENLVVVHTNRSADDLSPGRSVGDRVAVSWRDRDAVALDDALI
jgi:putative spermidine/putrescine transport system ATP-binding protein